MRASSATVSRWARPRSKSSSVAMPSKSRPSWTMANATSGWMPTMTVSAPRSLHTKAMVRSVRVAKESRTSTALTSMITPRDLNSPTCSESLSWNSRSSASDSADWIEATRWSPCFKMGTPTGHLLNWTLGTEDSCCSHVALLGAEQSARHLQSALDVANAVERSGVDADPDERLSVLGGDAGDHHGGAHESSGLGRLDQVVGHHRVHRGHAGDVDDHRSGSLSADGVQQALGDLAGAMGVHHADQWQEQEAVPKGEGRGRQLLDGGLLLRDHAVLGGQGGLSGR